MNAPIRLVVNADDFGLTPAISRGILRGHREGIVTSTSVLGNCVDPVALCAELAGAPKLGVGVHLALVEGRPVSDPESVPSLVDRDGRLPTSWRGVLGTWASGRLRADEVERELDAQVARLRDVGLVIDHLDSHQHVGMLPAVARAMEAVAVRHGIRGIRVRTEPPSLAWMGEPRRALAAVALTGLGTLSRRGLGSLRHGPVTWGFVESGRLDEIRVLEIIGRLSAGDNELICHPGEPDDSAPPDPDWQRPGELAAIRSTRVRHALERRGIELCRWSDLV